MKKSPANLNGIGSQHGDALEHPLDQVIDDDISATHLHRVPSGAHSGSTHRPYVAPDLRSRYGGDRPLLPCTDKTMGQRIFRVKKTLSEAQVPFETPSGDDMFSISGMPSQGQSDLLPVRPVEARSFPKRAGEAVCGLQELRPSDY